MASVSRWGVGCIRCQCVPTVATVVLGCHAQQQHHQCPAGLFHLCPFLEFSPLTIRNGRLLHHLSHQDDSGYRLSEITTKLCKLGPKYPLSTVHIFGLLFVDIHFCTKNLAKKGAAIGVEVCLSRSKRKETFLPVVHLRSGIAHISHDRHSQLKDKLSFEIRCYFAERLLSHFFLSPANFDDFHSAEND